jgi:hypothetical protein
MACEPSAVLAHAYTLNRAAGIKLLRSFQRQGFRDAVDPKATLTYVGSISTRRSKYVVYRFEVGPENHYTHWGEEVIIATSVGKYYGACGVIDLPRIRIRGRDVLFSYPKADGNVIRFTKDGPPRRCYLNGQLADMPCQATIADEESIPFFPVMRPEDYGTHGCPP